MMKTLMQRLLDLIVRFFRSLNTESDMEFTIRKLYTKDPTDK